MKTFNCYYINLRREEDRNTLIQKELDKIFHHSIVKRIDGFESKIKGLGCSLSHIKCLTDFIKSDKEYAIIFEDDFQLELTPKDCLKAIDQAIESNVNLFLLGYHSLLIDLDMQKRNGYLCPFTNGQMACGYMVSKSYAPTLLENFKMSSNMLSKNKDYNLYALDQYWKILQHDERVYACVPRLGKQRASYSSIEKEFVDYEGFCYNIIISNDKSCNINLPFQYRIIEEKDIRQNIEDVLEQHPNVDYLSFIDNVFYINKTNYMRCFKMFAINKLPYICFDDYFFVSKKYLNVLYDLDFKNLNDIRLAFNNP